MRALNADEAAERIRWLCDGDLPPGYGAPGCTGFNPADRWPAAVWVLNAMYERDDMPAGLTHHELRQHAIAAGLEEPEIVGGVNLDEATVTTGGGLGFQEKPPSPWRRLTWSELGRRQGFGFWAVDGKWPQLRFRPQAEWDDRATMPAGTWPLVRHTGQSSWPVSILPPTEGSLDAESLDGVIEVLSGCTAPEALGDCSFYYGAAAFMREGPTIYAGHLHELPALVRGQRGTPLTPNNMWARDHSWLVYTDYDLHATRVNGSAELINELCEHHCLETFRCAQPLGS
jgi:hypothetical protein